MRPNLHANTNEAGWGEAYANICLNCNTRQNVVIPRVSEWFSLKYRLQADSVRSASDQTEAVFLSSVTRLHCYTCLLGLPCTHFCSNVDAALEAEASRGTAWNPCHAVPCSKECFSVSARCGMFYPYCAWGGEFLGLGLLSSTNSRWLGSRQPRRHAARFVAPSTLTKERQPRALACLSLKCIPSFTGGLYQFWLSQWQCNMAIKFLNSFQISSKFSDYFLTNQFPWLFPVSGNSAKIRKNLLKKAVWRPYAIKNRSVVTIR